MNKLLWLCLPLFLMTVACKEQPTGGYTSSGDGYAYKLLSIGDGRESAANAEGVMCEVILRSSGDSVFFNSHYHASQGFYIRLRNASRPSGKHHIATLTEGDSISMMIGKTCFFREYFDTLVPAFLKQDSMVQLDLKIVRILWEVAAAEDTNPEVPDRELEELKEIDDYLNKHYPHVSADSYGLYTLEHSTGSSETVAPGKRIKVSYSGFYLNGNPVDNGRQQLEFVFGTPDQLIKGLNIVIGRLKKGETTKIIVPSRLAFGETGSTNGSIPPYTPLLYNLTLIDIK